MSRPHHHSNPILFKLIAKTQSFHQSASNLLRPWKVSHVISVIICCIITFTFLFENYSQSQFTISRSIKNGNKYYIFGYGSLINEESRKQTGITGKAIPARIHNMKRGWIYDVDTIHHPKLSNTPYTAVGVTIVNNFDSTVNGVIFDIEYDEIPKYDEREARYQRYEINPKDIEILTTQKDNDDSFHFLDENAIVYVYIVPDEIVLSLDDINSRILKQSYIDKFLAGCFDVDGYEFAMECIKSTDGWNGFYKNDRDKSLFSQEKITPEVIRKIDDILGSENLPFLKQSAQ